LEISISFCFLKLTTLPPEGNVVSLRGSGKLIELTLKKIKKTEKTEAMRKHGFGRIIIKNIIVSLRVYQSPAYFADLLSRSDQTVISVQTAGAAPRARLRSVGRDPPAKIRYVPFTNCSRPSSENSVKQRSSRSKTTYETQEKTRGTYAKI